ncbi:MAG: SDR family NAD(P)-dependent oxidoreductase [Bacteroidales bacterium]
MSFALVTGGSSGIGFCYASILASKGYSIIIVSHQEILNRESVESLRHDFLVEVHYITIDLAVPEAAQQVYNFCLEKEWEIEILVNNAGIFFFNTVDKTELSQSNKMLQLHITTPTLLCALFGKEMKKRRKGYILNASSICAWTSYPTIAIYGSSKRYLKEFSKALAFELSDFGVKVCAVCPGAVDTGLYNLTPSIRKRCCQWGIMLSPYQVAQKGIKALLKGEKCKIPGKINYLFIFFIFLAPHFLIDLIKRHFKIMQDSD